MAGPHSGGSQARGHCRAAVYSCSVRKEERTITDPRHNLQELGKQGAAGRRTDTDVTVGALS